MKQRFHLSLVAPLFYATIAVASPQNLLEQSMERMYANGFWLSRFVTVCEQVIDHRGELQFDECEDYETDEGSDRVHLRFNQTGAHGQDELSKEDGLSRIDFIYNLGLGLPYFLGSTHLTGSAREDSCVFNGINCSGYDFIASQGNRRFEGTLWINPENANPVRVELRFVEEDLIEINGMEIEHFYRITEFDEEEGIVIAKRFVAEAWSSHRLLFRRSLFVHRYTVEMDEHASEGASTGLRLHQYSQERNQCP